MVGIPWKCERKCVKKMPGERFALTIHGHMHDNVLKTNFSAKLMPFRRHFSSGIQTKRAWKTILQTQTKQQTDSCCYFDKWLLKHACIHFEYAMKFIRKSIQLFGFNLSSANKNVHTRIVCKSCRIYATIGKLRETENRQEKKMFFFLL